MAKGLRLGTITLSSLLISMSIPTIHVSGTKSALPAVSPVAIQPTTPVEKSIEKAVNYLLEKQQPDGNWADMNTLSYTALPAQALLGSPFQDRADVQTAIEKAIRKIMTEWAATLEQRKSGYFATKNGTTPPPGAIVAHCCSDCSNTITLLILAKNLSAFQNTTDQSAINSLINQLILALKDTQSTDGSWAKYFTDTPKANFMVAEVMQALATAKSSGYTVDQTMINNSITWMTNQANGGYIYLGGAISRRVAGELALVNAGANRLTQLETAVDQFFTDRKVLEQIRLLQSTHQTDYAALSTTGYMFGYFHVAKSLQVLGEIKQKQYLPILEETFVQSQKPNGRWMCGPRIWDSDHTLIYNTAMGLEVLNRCLYTSNKPDLAFSFFGAKNPNGTVTVSYTIKNLSTSNSAGSCQVGFYLSSDSTLDGQDTLLGTQSVPSLGPTASAQNTSSFQVSNVTPYWIIGKIDHTDLVAEWNEQNNVAGSESKPELSISRLEASRVVAPGSLIYISDTIKNTGMKGSSTRFKVTYYLSTDSNIDSTDVVLGDREITATQASDTDVDVPGTSSFRIPSGTQLGDYYLIAWADSNNTVDEAIESNNTKSLEIRIVNRADLNFKSLSASPNRVNPGNQVTITDTIINEGSASAGAFNVRYYLSSDPLFEMSKDTFLAIRNVSSLAVGALNNGSTTVTISSSITPGSYYIVSVIDTISWSPTDSNVINNVTATPLLVGDPVTIDVMFVYTPAARDTVGGTAAMHAKIDLGIEKTTTAFVNSLVNIRFRLVYRGEVNYQSSGDAWLDLTRLQNKTDGYMDEVHTLRDQYGADLVQFCSEAGGGIGYLLMSQYMSSPASFAGNAFSIIEPYFQWDHMAHEMGHNMGCMHDISNRKSNMEGAYPYSFGLVFKGNSPIAWGTIMTYTNKAPHYSNPFVPYDGASTGVDYDFDKYNPADNSRSLNNVAKFVADFRPTMFSLPPATPTNLSGPTTGLTSNSYSFSASTTDPEGNPIQYIFDWGDGTTTTTSFFTSGATASASHSWSTAGTYSVKTKAIDSLGAFSSWSLALAVTISAPGSSDLVISDMWIPGQI